MKIFLGAEPGAKGARLRPHEEINCVTPTSFQIKDAIAILRGESSSLGGPIISGPLEALAVGAALTGFNVYFLAWWLTVGYPIIEESPKLGLKGFAAMYLSHVWMDYAWLIMLAVSGGATRVLGVLPYAILLAALAAILAAFALKIAFDTAKQAISGRAP